MITEWTSEGMVWTLDSLKHNFMSTRYWSALTMAANERGAVTGAGFAEPSAGEFLKTPVILAWLTTETVGGALYDHATEGGWFDHRSPVAAGDTDFGAPWTLAALLADIGDPIIEAANHTIPTPEYMMLCYEILNRLKWRYRRESFGRVDAAGEHKRSGASGGLSNSSYADALAKAIANYDNWTPASGWGGYPSIGQRSSSGARLGSTWGVDFFTEGQNFYSGGWANDTGSDREVDYYFVPEKWDASTDYDCPFGFTEGDLNAVATSLSCPDGTTGVYEFDLGLDAYPRHPGYATEPADPSYKGWCSSPYGVDADSFHGAYGLYRYDIANGFQFQT